MRVLIWISGLREKPRQAWPQFTLQALAFARYPAISGDIAAVLQGREIFSAGGLTLHDATAAGFGFD